MNIIDVKKAVIEILQAGLVPHITGSPGVGKSDIIRDVMLAVACIALVAWAAARDAARDAQNDRLTQYANDLMGE